MMRRSELLQRIALGAAAVAALLWPGLTLAAHPLTVDQERTLARADSLWHQGERDSLWLLLERELTSPSPGADSCYALELLVRQGMTRAALGMGREAEPFLRRALAMAVGLNDPGQQRNCLRWLAVALLRLGERAEARTTWDELLALSQAARDPVHEAWALTGLAYDDWLQGRAPPAEQRYARAAALFRAARDTMGEAWASNGRGMVLSASGDFDRARTAFETAADLSRRGGFAGVEALARNNIACLLYQLGDPSEAQRCFREVRDLHLHQGNVAEAVTAGVNLALCARELGHPDLAIETLEGLLSQCRAAGLSERETMVAVNLSREYVAQGRHREGAALARSVLAHGDAVAAREEVEALIVLSVALSETGSTAAALALLREHWPHVVRVAPAEYRIRYGITLGGLSIENGAPEEALDVLLAVEDEARRLDLDRQRMNALAGAAAAERALGQNDRALAHLRSAASIWQAIRGVPADPEWREARTITARKIYPLLGALLLEYPPGTPQVQRVRDAFDALQELKARTLLERMLGPRMVDSQGGGAAPLTSVGLQQQVLRPGEVFLDYYVGTYESLLFVITPQDCREIQLPPWRDLDPPIRMLHAYLSAPGDPHAAREENELAVEACREAADLLLGPAAREIASSRRVIVCPDRMLNLVPFQALLQHLELPAASEAATINRQMQRVPSGTILAQLRSRPPAGPRTPAREGTILALAGSSVGSRGPLPGAQREVRALARRFRCVTTRVPLRGNDPDSILKTFGDFEVLHFAAHVTVDDRHPWQSSIRASGGSAEGDTLDVRAFSVAGHPLSASLAVLAGCRSAEGGHLDGEGVQGLSGAFLSAGVPAVLATLWPVADGSTARLLERFYDHLRRGESVGAALAAAQASLRANPHTRHPFHWAGIVLIGDGDLWPAVQPRPQPFWPYASAGAALAAAVLVAAGVRHRARGRRSS